MKSLWIAVAACLLLGCQTDKAATEKASIDKPAEKKVQRDADRDRNVNNVQEQWRSQVQH